MTFGKYKGMELEDIIEEDTSYIMWLSEFNYQTRRIENE